MKTGEYIRILRTGGNAYGKKWSQAELGQLLNPKVNRAAVNKWENGIVVNIRQTHIEQLARLFGVTPNDLLCFGSDYNEEQIAEEVKVIEELGKHFGSGAVQLLQYFTQLNHDGKQKALEDLADLTEIPKYSK